MRPFNRWIRTGSPHVGRLLYNVANFTGIAGDYIPFALTVAPHPPTTRNARYLPGTVCLFPGYGWSGVNGKRVVGRQKLHHITMRETDNGNIVAYAHLKNAQDEPDRKRRRLRVTPETDFLHLTTSWIGSLSALDQAGFAQMGVDELLSRVTPSVVHYRGGKGVLRDVIRFSEILRNEPNHLKSIFFLARRPPEEIEMDAILRFTIEVEGYLTESPVLPNAGYDGQVSLGATSFDLRSPGQACEFPFLVHLRGVLPGKLRNDFSVAAFPAELPARALSQQERDRLIRQPPI